MKQDSKSVIRRKILNLLENQKEEEKLKKSQVVQNKLFETSEFKQAEIILFYASFDGEVETFRMMKQAQRLGKKIALPTIIRNQRKFVASLVKNLDTELVDGPYGIKQSSSQAFCPVLPQDLDLVIVPGVAFDAHNNRLGRGGGYYDRFLVSLPVTTPTFGLAFDFQILKRLPHLQEHDIKVTRVLAN